MPIPTPNPGESEREFISRCMSSDVMQREYPRQDQRAAVCYSSFRRAREKVARKNAVRRYRQATQEG